MLSSAKKDITTGITARHLRLVSSLAIIHWVFFLVFSIILSGFGQPDLCSVCVCVRRGGRVFDHTGPVNFTTSAEFVVSHIQRRKSWATCGTCSMLMWRKMIVKLWNIVHSWDEVSQMCARLVEITDCLICDHRGGEGTCGKRLKYATRWFTFAKLCTWSRLRPHLNASRIPLPCPLLYILCNDVTKSHVITALFA